MSHLTAQFVLFHSKKMIIFFISIKNVYEVVFNKKSNVDCFLRYRGVLCLKSTIAHLTERILYYHGANRDGNQLFQQT